MSKRIKSLFKTNSLLLSACMFFALSIGFTNPLTAQDDPDVSFLAYNRGKILRNGLNTLYGTFYYKGSPYGFEISFRYNARTGKVSEASYKATGYTSGSTQKITNMTISKDERRINISDTNLRINVYMEEYGIYSGSMKRGDHSGTCEIYLEDI